MKSLDVLGRDIKVHMNLPPFHGTLDFSISVTLLIATAAVHWSIILAVFRQVNSNYANVRTQNIEPQYSMSALKRLYL